MVECMSKPLGLNSSARHEIRLSFKCLVVQMPPALRVPRDGLSGDGRDDQGSATWIPDIREGGAGPEAFVAVGLSLRRGAG